MTFDDAAEALANAAAADSGMGSPEPAPAPAPVAEPAGEQPSTPEGSNPDAGAAPAQPVDTPSLYEGTSVNPDELVREHPELEPLVKQLQATFTVKTQGLAEQRKALEGMGSPEEIQEAIETYQFLQDPNNWPTVHEQLSQQMQLMGMSPAQAAHEAARQLEESGVATPAPASGDLAQLLADPELAPVAAKLSEMDSLKARLDQFEQAQAAQQAAWQQEQQQMAMVGELQRQEGLIRDANPTYTQDDIDDIYELASFFEGDLFAAQQRFEDRRARLLQQHLEGKATVAAQPATVPVAEGAASEVPETVMSLEEGHKAAMKVLEGLDDISFE